MNGAAPGGSAAPRGHGAFIPVSYGRTSPVERRCGMSQLDTGRSTSVALKCQRCEGEQNSESNCELRARMKEYNNSNK